MANVSAQRTSPRRVELTDPQPINGIDLTYAISHDEL